MEDETLRQFLTQAIKEVISGKREGGEDLPPVSGALQEDKGGFAEKIAQDLILEAATRGLPLTRSGTKDRNLSGGNTAEMVALFTLHAPFAFKLDRKTPKLAEEAKMMQAIRNNPRLPSRFREAWPIIYAIRDKAPFAYLMEYFPIDEGWLSLEDRLYPKSDALASDDPGRLIDTVLDLMFEGFEGGLNTRARPNIAEDYLGRIRSRLADAAKLDPRFRSQSLSINGTVFQPWHHYVEMLEENTAVVDRITPRFNTVVHGDPNPGNIMLRTGEGKAALKFIDPKEWGSGDYLFDITKLTHFIEGTGPIEKPAAGTHLEVSYEESATFGAVLSYSFQRPAWTSAIIEACRARVARFARLHQDAEWEARYELGMAANLLGLPAGRMTKTPPRKDAALALYGEGLIWLARFCARLEPRATAIPVANQSPGLPNVVPAQLRDIRDFVRQQLPEAVEAMDRRGFKLLHWTAAQANSQGKPVELSLEHEARLAPRSGPGLDRLRTALRGNEALPARAALLQGDDRFGHLIVVRYDRPPGPQSVDLYYDLKNVAPADGFIASMITVRQRRMTSKFMTWSSDPDDGMRPLNVELPFVGYGDSGVVGRLEFNWIADLDEDNSRFLLSTGTRHEDFANPLYLASRVSPLPQGEFEAVLAHTTFREKFALRDPGLPTGEQDVFHLNIDDITVQSIRSGRVASYTDIDVAPCREVDASVLSKLINLSTVLSSHYDLEPIRATKAWSDIAKTDGF